MGAADERTAPAAPASVRTRAATLVGDHVVLVAVLGVAFALRLGWVLSIEPFTAVGQMAVGDQEKYFYYGREIAAGHGYVSAESGRPTAYYPIGFPATLAVLFWVVGHTPLPDNYLLAAELLNVVFGTATVFLSALLARALFGPLAALVAAGIVAVFPNLVHQAGTVQLETAFTFWGLGALCILATHDWSAGLPSPRRLSAFGAVLGVSVLIRPFSVWFVVALLVAVLVAGAGWRKALVAMAVPLGVVVVMSVPWTVRNAIRMDGFVATSTNTGDTLCLDRSDDADGGFRFAEHDGCADPTLPEVERNAESTRKAITWVVENPGREIVQIGRRARLIFASDHDGVEAVNFLGKGEILAPSTVRSYSDLADGYFWGVSALAAVGLVVAVRARPVRPATVLVLISLASLVAVPLLLWGNPRFHLPFSPLLGVLAGGAVAAGVDARRRRRPGPPSRSVSGQPSA